MPTADLSAAELSSLMDAVVKRFRHLADPPSSDFAFRAFAVKGYPVVVDVVAPGRYMLTAHTPDGAAIGLRPVNTTADAEPPAAAPPKRLPPARPRR